MKILILCITAFAIAFILLRRRVGPRAAAGVRRYLRRPYLLSISESLFYQKLQEALDENFMAMAKVRISDLARVDPANGLESTDFFQETELIADMSTS